MSYLLLVLVGVVVTLIFVIERRMAARKQEKSETLLQEWGQQALIEPAARQWLAAQHPKEIKQLLRQLRRFGKRGNFDVNLVLQNGFGNNEELKGRATAVLTNYLNAIWQQVDMQADLQAHLFFTAYQKQPKKRTYHDFNLDLYVRLVEAGLAESPSLADSIMVTDWKQQRTARTAILQTAERDRPAFNQALKETLQAQAMAKKSTRRSWQRATPQVGEEPLPA